MKFSSLCLALFLLTPLSGEVFAQSAESADPTAFEVSSTTATTTEIHQKEVEKEPWYKIENIMGNIEVGDFVVGPGRSEVELSPGDTAIVYISVANRIGNNRQFKLEVEDVEGSPKGDKALNLLGDKKGLYSVRDYISVEGDVLELDLGERARIPVRITVPPNTEPGGYYGSVLVSTIRQPENEQALAPRSPVIARVGSLIFLRVKGDVDIGGETKSITTIGDKWWYEKGPIDFSILYENTGSVHVNPYGQLSITNMFGEEVGFVELEPWFVLPKSLRSREMTWSREFLLGRYTVTAQINRGYDDIVDTVTVSFWVLPWKIVVGTFVTLFIIIFSIRSFFRTFEFKRKA